jgi:hypothetical protein
MTKLEQVKWKREWKEGGGSGAQSPTRVAAAAAAAAPAPVVAPISALRVTPPASPTSAVKFEAATAVAPTDLRDRLTTGGLQQEVEKLAREKECLMLAAIEEISALEKEVEAYRSIVGSVADATALGKHTRSFVMYTSPIRRLIGLL